ncbi:MAG: PKD domain-containing protein [Parcubacteria group bacterium]|nr:PKD domain-containing protein [Parcubacteria group bacterium]
MKKFLLVAIIFLAPFGVHAAADLSIGQNDIRFSEDPLIVGDTVRIYASITNSGDEDVSGYVTFYQGAAAIGQSQVISVIAGGNPEDVYLDFVVPPGSFNIQAIIQGTDPEDMNTGNDFTITNTLVPIEDSDRDGVEDSQDNCPQTSNANQQNTDGDSYGDACDSDDDNDGLSDDVEVELGSSTTITDTDADGVDDASDAYPTDPNRSVIEVVPVVIPVITDTSERFKQIIADLAVEIEETNNGNLSDTSIVSAGNNTDDLPVDSVRDISIKEASIEISPNAVFSFQRNSWNTYTFTLLSPEESGAVYRWDFGDGVSSSKTSVSHTYATSGAFQVTLSIQNDTGVYDQESSTVLVPFLSLGNRIVLVAVLFLTLLLIVGCGVLVMTFRRSRNHKR